MPLLLPILAFMMLALVLAAGRVADLDAREREQAEARRRMDEASEAIRRSRKAA